MKTFLFYDIETSGLSPYFDQVLTFAGIRTDLDLNEIERHEITVKLRLDIVPSPSAFITHRLMMERLNKGICEYDAAIRIYKILNTPGTISLGYNTLGFDDEFLRFLFYRNLLDPYRHQYHSGCVRMDLLPLTLLYKLFKPDILKWPDADGKPTLKLEALSQCNQLVLSGRAHEAITDVEATLALAKQLKSKQKMWDYSLGFFDKLEDRKRIEAVEKRIQVGNEVLRLGILVSLSIGSDLMYMAPVLSIGHSTAYTNQSLWLRLDKIMSFNDIADDSINEVPLVRKRYGESPFILPPLPRFWGRLSSESKEICKSNLSLIRENEIQFFSLVKQLQDYTYPCVPDLDPDASLYQDGFFSAQEKNEALLFHRTPAENRPELINSFISSRIKVLAARILYRNSVEQPLISLNKKYDVQGKAGILHPDLYASVKGYRNDAKLSRQEALDEIKSLRKSGNLDQEQVVIVSELESYLTAT